MASRTLQTHYYTNPAFTQQSEFTSHQRALSPARSLRHSPIGAQAPFQVCDTSFNEDILNDNEEYEEQEFYEEMLVDDCGTVRNKKIVVISQNNDGKKYLQIPQSDTQGSRYGFPQQMNASRSYEEAATKNRYEYIPMKETNGNFISQSRTEDIEMSSGKTHRYAVIETEEDTNVSCKNTKYALVPLNELQNVTQNRDRYEYIQCEASPTKNNLDKSRISAQSRYEYIPQEHRPLNHPTSDHIRQLRSPARPPIQASHQTPHQTPIKKPLQPLANPIATQKLHELLSTPRKTRVKHSTPQKVLSPQTRRRNISPQSLDPFVTPGNSPQKEVQLPKAQQRLNYALGARGMANGQDKRFTAVVAPMCSSPALSVYSQSEMSYPCKSESWNEDKKPVQVTLAVAAVMMTLCGSVTSGLCFYMISILGRLYYLDFSVVSGFTCLILGLLGFRTRNCYWLPNRNYISGYIVLSFFSLSTCAGLLTLLLVQPRAGTPLADITSGAVCGISVLSLIMAGAGVIASYCCKYPPPDNRVQHCSPSFRV